MNSIKGPARRLAAASAAATTRAHTTQRVFLLSATTIPTASSSSSRIPQNQHSRRTFTTTPAPSRQTPTHRTVPPALLPDYPHGRHHTYKQRNEGLYGSSKIRFGNAITGKKGVNSSPRISPAQWRPNRHTKRLWSRALQGFIRVRLTTPVLKTIDKLGGIDEYLLGSKSRRVKELGPAGWALRWKVMQTPAVQERFAREREALGLPPKQPETVEGATTTTTATSAAAAAAAVAAAGGMGGDGGKMTSAAEVEAVMSRVDAMLAADEEFVLEREGVEEATSATADAVARERLGEEDQQKQKQQEEDIMVEKHVIEEGGPARSQKKP